jgi:hypothetical protein
MGVSGWQNIHADLNQLEQWVSKGYEGVGVLCRDNPAVDIDVLDEDVSRQMVDAVLQQYPGGLVRVGKAPKTLLSYRTDKPFKKVRSSTYEDKNGSCHAVEILGNGQQYVAYAEHPDTLQPYTWERDGIFSVKADDLPVLNLEDALKIVKKFEGIAKEKCVSAGWIKVREGTVGSVEPTSSDEQYDIIPANFVNLRPPLDITVHQIRRDLASIQSRADNYDSWLRVGMALWHQFDGSEDGLHLWDEWSENSDAYEGIEDLRSRWTGFQSDSNSRPITFATVRMWANEARMADDPKAEFLNRYVYVTEGDSVHDLDGFPYDRPMKLTEFKNTTANKRMEIEAPAPLVAVPDRTLPKMVPVHSQWMIDSERKLAQGFVYKPGKSRILNEAGGRQWINTFYMPPFPNPCKIVVENDVTKVNLKCVESQLDIFFRHMEYIIPVEEEREWFYDWMAFNVKRPGERCKVTPLLIATDHGTGRGWIVQLMNRLLGSWNCTKTKMSTLSGESNAGQFQDFMNDSLLCCIEEVREGDKRYGVTDAIRDYLTEDTLEINSKYGGKQTKPVYTNFLFNSNHVDALTLKEEDRRINVFRTVDGPKNKDYYDRLYGWLKPEEMTAVEDENAVPEDAFYDRAGVNVSIGVACLYHWLRARDLTSFNWNTSMHNKARQDLIENNQTEIETAFLEMVKNPPHEVMTLTEIESFLEEQIENPDNPFGGLSSNVSKQVEKLAQHHLTRQDNKVKLSRRRHQNGVDWETLEKPKYIRGWSFSRNKQFSTEEIRKMYESR